MKRQVKLFDPVIDDNELRALERILKGKSWADGSGSKQVRKFEEEFQKENNSDFSNSSDELQKTPKTTNFENQDEDQRSDDYIKDDIPF